MPLGVHVGEIGLEIRKVWSTRTKRAFPLLPFDFLLDRFQFLGGGGVEPSKLKIGN